MSITCTTCSNAKAGGGDKARETLRSVARAIGERACKAPDCEGASPSVSELDSASLRHPRRMAVVLILEPIFEADFLDCSKGFRPGRGAHDATEQIRANLKAGFCEVYDADLAGYFDSIPHDKLLDALRMRIVDRSVLKLIRQWLEVAIVEEDPQTTHRLRWKRDPTGRGDLATVGECLPALV